MDRAASRESRGIQHLWEYLLLPPYRITDQESTEGDFYSALKAAAEWPPDVFCLAAAVLSQFGASTWLTSERMASLRDEAIKMAEMWENEITSPDSSSSKTQTLQVWGKLVAVTGQFTSQSYSTRYYAAVPEVMEILATLLMMADHVCRGFGLPSAPSSGESELRGIADFLLEPEEFGSTLCKAIHPAKARVLPKTHTPPSGRTLRSLSHNLCYVEADEGRPLWYTVPSCVSPMNRMNLLLIPYPPAITASCFKDHGPLEPMGSNPPPHSAFSFQPIDTCGRAAWEICNLVEQAERNCSPVHVVLLPEGALSAADYRLLRNYLLARKIMLIAGLGGPTEEGTEENRLSVDIPLSTTYAVHLRQRKHHPWCINRDQILQYELANELDTRRIYWEKIRVGDRNTHFVALHPRILASILICEDLAQYEPVGRLIRAVGPHLVVALLLDGPQIGGRWPERYAAVLTDDPGCSVLSLTSAGMSKRSKPIASAADRSRVIALWKDPKTRREIELDAGSSAVILTLTFEEQDEWTADRRVRRATVLRLAQCLQVASPSKESEYASWFGEHKPPPPIKFLAPVEASALARLARLRVASPQESPPNYSMIFSRLGPEGRRVARQMLWAQRGDKFGPTDNPGGMEMGPEEQRQANLLARWGARWREDPEGYSEAESTAKEIACWAQALEMFG